MSTRRNTWFYALLIAVVSVTATLVVTSQWGLSPNSSAQTLLGTPPPINSAPITGPVTASTFREVASTAMPAVVNIRTESRQEVSTLRGFPGDDLLERFFGGEQAPEPEVEERLVPTAGTGFIIDTDGYILTNNHVVEGADRIFVSLYGDESDLEFPAEIVGRDPLTDSALIRLTEVPDHALPVVRFGDSSQMQPGDWVMAIGNPFTFSHTVSVGVVSAVERELDVTPDRDRKVRVLQTDAAINQGNSGGPLLNLRGEVIGINTAIYTGSMAQGNIGIGFAVPSNTVRDLLPQLRAGKVTRGRIGVYIEPVLREAVDEFGLEDRQGAVISRIEAGGAASRAGLQPGDVILTFDGQPVEDSDALVRIVAATRPGATVPVRVMRDQREQTLRITVDELDAAAQNGGTPARGGNGAEPATSSGFGMTISNITPDTARQLELDTRQGVVVTQVEEGGAAFRRLLAGDVIVRIGREPIASVTDAERELNRIPSGGTAFFYVLRETRNGRQETFVPVTKD